MTAPTSTRSRPPAPRQAQEGGTTSDITNRVGKVLYWAGLSGVWCLASLYLAAAWVAPASALQITAMLGMIEGSDTAILYARLYTALLILTPLFALAGIRHQRFRPVTLGLAGSVLGLTVLPVTNSLLHDFRPRFYENYIGEGLTILALVVLSVAVAMTGRQTRARHPVPTQPATRAVEKPEGGAQPQPDAEGRDR